MKTSKIINNNSIPIFGAVVVYVIYLIYKKIFGASEKDLERKNDALEAVNSVIKPNLSNCTFSQSQAKIWCNQIVDAFGGGSNLGNDDEDLVIDIFENIQNSDDMRLLYKTFGVRLYSDWWKSGNTYLDLTGWLSEEGMIDTLQTKLNWL